MNQDLLFNIMLNLNIIDLYHMCNVSNLTKLICNDKFFWQQKNLIDGNKVNLNDILPLVKETVQLLNNHSLMIFLPDDRFDPYLHQLINNTTNVPTPSTYIDIKINNNELIYTMINSATHHNVYEFKNKLSINQLKDLFIYLFYFYDDFRYYANVKNYKYFFNDIIFAPKSHWQ